MSSRDCTNCKMERLCIELDRMGYTRGCNGHPPLKQKTNADKIRAMTDEKLAGFSCDRGCAYCPIDDCDGRASIGHKACYNRWLDWLKQEATG